MPQPYEVTILVLGFGVIGYVFVVARDDIKRIPHRKLLLSSFFIQFLSWIIAALHRSFLSGPFGEIEDLLITTATVLLLVWCNLSVKPEPGRGK